MVQSIKRILALPDLRRRALSVLMMIAGYRLLSRMIETVW